MNIITARLTTALAVALAALPAAAQTPPKTARKVLPPSAGTPFDPWKDFDAWRERALQDLRTGRGIPPSRFDELFDDGFFGGNPDPFALIERFEKRFAPELQGPEKDFFGRSWDDWYRDRIGLGEVKETVETTDDAVILSFAIPGLDAKSVKLDVGHGRVRLAYDARSVRIEKDAKGRVTSRSESVSRYEKAVPVPAQADPDKYRVEKKGGVIRVIFERDRGGLKS